MNTSLTQILENVAFSIKTRRRKQEKQKNKKKSVAIAIIGKSFLFLTVSVTALKANFISNTFRKIGTANALRKVREMREHIEIIYEQEDFDKIKKGELTP